MRIGIVAFFALFSGALLAGCFSPDYGSGHLQCASDGSCPMGFHCATNNRCYRDGDNPDIGVDLDGGDDLSKNDLLSTLGPDMTQHVPVWTRHAMLPTAGNFYGPGGLWGSSATDLYILAVDKSTNQGSIWHSTDAIDWTEQWSAGTSSSPPAPDSLWGSSPHNIYAVGARALLHTSGDGTWQDESFLVPVGIDASDLSSVWGSGLNDIYLGPVTRASDSSLGVLHLVQSASYQTTPMIILSAFWGSGSTDIYASGAAYGAASTIWHSAGDGSWQKQAAYTPAVQISSFWGSGPNDIYAAGNVPNDATTATNAILHSAGNGSWTAQLQDSVPLATGPLLSFVYGTGPNDVYAGPPLMHSTGNGIWQPVDTVNAMNDVVGSMWSASPDQIFVVASAQDGINSPIIWIYE